MDPSVILAIMNNAAKNMKVQKSLKATYFVPFSHIPRGVLLDCMVALFLIFWGSSILCLITAVLIYIPTNLVQGFLFLHVFANTCYLIFLIIAILTSLRWYLIVILMCIALMISDAEHFFIYLLAILCCLWKNVHFESILTEFRIFQMWQLWWQYIYHGKQFSITILSYLFYANLFLTQDWHWSTITEPKYQ